MQGSYSPRRRDAGPGLPLHYVNDISTQNARRDPSRFVPVIELVGVSTTEWLQNNPQCAKKARFKIVHVSSELYFLSFVATAAN